MVQTLRQQMTTDARAILSGAELGESATWSDGTDSSRLMVRVVDQGERQQIRRASLFAVPGDIPTVSTGHTFTIWRDGTQLVYRVLYADRTETALRRHVCHEQLTEMFRVIDRKFYKSTTGNDEFARGSTSPVYRGKLVPVDAANVRRSGNRKMRSSFNLYLETVPPLTTDQIVLDSTDRAFRIQSVERPVDRIDLPYLVLQRSDA